MQDIDITDGHINFNTTLVKVHPECAYVKVTYDIISIQPLLRFINKEKAEVDKYVEHFNTTLVKVHLADKVLMGRLLLFQYNPC